MYVACPSCQSLFQIQPAHLRAAHGEVRCGVCQHTFNASDAVFEDAQQAIAFAGQRVAREIDELVDKALDQVPSADAFAGDDLNEPPPAGNETPPMDEPAAPAASQVDDERRETGRLVSADDSRVLPGEAYRFHADTDFYAQPARAEYSSQQQADSGTEATFLPAGLFADESAISEARTDWGAIATGVVLTLLLLVQYTFAERYQLASDPRLRPALEVFCGLLRCDLPLRREVGSVEMVEREVTDHPNVADALLINAAFVNRAAFRQAYPLFQVTFSDVSGTPVALRRFRPREYLDAGADPSAGIASGERIRLTLEVIDPGDSAVSFQFEFL